MGIQFGSIAQPGEHMPYKHGVTGSSPVVPTKKTLKPQGLRGIRKYVQWRGEIYAVVRVYALLQSC